jgi:hypothetical protein
MLVKLKTYVFTLVITGSALTVSCTFAPKLNKTNLSVEDKALNNWVLSYCIANTLEAGAAKQDALNTAGAYLEAGNQPIEAYEQATQLIKDYLAKNYTGVTQGAFNTKKCIDLYESRDLALLIRRFKKN